MKKKTKTKKSEVDRLLSNNKKAKKILNWKPKYVGKKGFEAAIKETYRWFQNKNNTKFIKQIFTTSKSMKKILVFTGSRADYGILRPLI